MKWQELSEQQCSVARTLAVIGDRWTLMILRDLFLGVKRFESFRDSLGISRTILTDRLNLLEAEGVVRKLPYQDRPVRHGYHLTQKGIEGARLDAEVLLAHVLTCERITLYTHFDKPLAKPEVDAYRELIRRRAKRVPAKHLTGRCEFASIELDVSPAVLIPRPETEFAVKAAIDVAEDDPGTAIFDMGSYLLPSCSLVNFDYLHRDTRTCRGLHSLADRGLSESQRQIMVPDRPCR